MTTATLTLADFLLARIAEDEVRATTIAAAGADPKFSLTVWPHDGDKIPFDAPAFTAARVLAECAAKRRIVGEHRLVEPTVYDHLGPGCDVCVSAGSTVEVIGGPCPTLLFLATVYADHPDYRDEWRP